MLITASSKSDSVIHEACEMSRKRGRIVLVGVVGLNMRRDDFYKKELTFQVSCSYGPGRYDEDYENRGIDYPLPYVRWTEKRNFETILNLLSVGSLNVKSLITDEYDLEDYDKIYGDMRKQGSIASILRYSDESELKESVSLATNGFKESTGKMGIIGAGNFTSSTVIPALLKAGADVKYISSRTNGLEAKNAARKMKAEIATTNYKAILDDPEVSTVICTTRHNAHAQMVCEALESGKSVFVEKPLCLNRDELDRIIETYGRTADGTTLTVGFNRRFSPFAVQMKKLLGDGPKNIVATMNAGYIPPEMWVHDMETGGGRIIGEACHFIDLCSFLADSSVKAVCVNALGNNPKENTDNMSILLKYANGSNAVINYFSNGSKSYPKEKVEVFYQDKVLALNNWRLLEGFGFRNFRKMKGRMDKGHKAEFMLLTERSRKGGEPLIPFDSIVNTTKSSFACIESLKSGSWIEV